MAKIAFIFPGQGSQAVGMGRSLYEGVPVARDVIDTAIEALRAEVDLRTLLFDGPEDELKRTANTQPAILTVSCAVHAALTAAAPDLAPSFVAGHSLGEWSALVAAGTMPFVDAVRAVRQRGVLMQEAVPAGKGAMSAVIGLGSDEVRAICEEVSTDEGPVSPANYNSPEQTVIAGEAGAVEVAGGRLKRAGAKRVLPLPVSAPFHCKLMTPVQAPLGKVIADIALTPPSVPLVSNVEATSVQSTEQIASLLVQQVVSPVRWVETIEYLASEGVTHLIELGPGKVLAGLVRRIDKGLTCVSVHDLESLEAALGKVAEAA